jgi:multidrug efflux pump subunit AcrA (membrane-fusion protein)
MSDRPDLSALKIDDRARRTSGRGGRRLLLAALVGILLLALGLYAFLREGTLEVQVAAVRADKGGRPALLNFKRGLIAEQQLDTARTAVDSFKARVVLAREQVSASEAKIEMAKQDIDNCIVRAPFTGIVVSKDAQRGEMVSPISAGGGFTRTGIATLVDMTSLEIEVDVNESYIARVRNGQPVTAVLDAYPDWQIPTRRGRSSASPSPPGSTGRSAIAFRSAGRSFRATGSSTSAASTAAGASRTTRCSSGFAGTISMNGRPCAAASWAGTPSASRSRMTPRASRRSSTPSSPTRRSRRRPTRRRPPPPAS